MLRLDVTYMKPDNYREVGLVDYPPGAEQKTPTLFIGAYCSTEKDRKWFKKQVKEIMRRSKKHLQKVS